MVSRKNLQTVTSFFAVNAIPSPGGCSSPGLRPRALGQGRPGPGVMSSTSRISSGVADPDGKTWCPRVLGKQSQLSLRILACRLLGKAAPHLRPRTGHTQLSMRMCMLYKCTCTQRCPHTSDGARTCAPLTTRA